MARIQATVKLPSFATVTLGRTSSGGYAAVVVLSLTRTGAAAGTPVAVKRWAHTSAERLIRVDQTTTNLPVAFDATSTSYWAGRGVGPSCTAPVPGVPLARKKRR